MGSAAVRVMYRDDQETVWGYALSLKAVDENEEAWFWLEQLEHQEETKTESFTADGCTGCHSSGVDFVQSNWPLR